MDSFEGKPLYYDRQGNSIDRNTYAELVQHHEEYVVVEQTHVGEVFVSTVWLGFDHSVFRDGPPIIFETMVRGGILDEHQERYSTEEEARVGHKSWLAAVFITQALDGLISKLGMTPADAWDTAMQSAYQKELLDLAQAARNKEGKISLEKLEALFIEVGLTPPWKAEWEKPPTEATPEKGQEAEKGDTNEQ